MTVATVIAGQVMHIRTNVEQPLNLSVVLFLYAVRSQGAAQWEEAVNPTSLRPRLAIVVATRRCRGT